VKSRRFSISQDVEGVYRLKGELTIHDIQCLKHFLDSILVKCTKNHHQHGRSYFCGHRGLAIASGFPQILNFQGQMGRQRFVL